MNIPTTYTGSVGRHNEGRPKAARRRTTRGRRLHGRALAAVALVGLLSWTGRSVGQDIHFSLVDVNPILFNPAYSGFFDGTGRFGVAYRNQWATVSAPFQTFAATGEIALVKRRYNRDGFGLGLILLGDRAGSLHYGTVSGTGVLSYYAAVNNYNFLSVAFEAGYGQTGFDASLAKFQEPNDPLTDQNVAYPLVGAGVAWYFGPTDSFRMKVGVAAHNLNQPKLTYLNTDDAHVYRRYNAYARLELRQWVTFSLLPMVAVQVQNQYRELMAGTEAKWYLSETRGQLFALSVGAYYRWRDAALVTATVEHNDFVYSIGYDVNLSKLTPASHTVGAFELQLVYRLGMQSKIKHKAMPCPII